MDASNTAIRFDDSYRDDTGPGVAYKPVASFEDFLAAAQQDPQVYAALHMHSMHPLHVPLEEVLYWLVCELSRQNRELRVSLQQARDAWPQPLSARGSA